MEMHQLRYVVAVARTGNFSRAAEQCHVAQPSLSQQIQKLEEELGERLFDRGFLDWLGGLKLTLDIDAVPEGTAVFPLEPLVRVRGRIVEAQIIESALLNLINFQSLIATKSARVNLAAAGQTVLEFGLRRAQGIDGSLSASRAAFIGG